MLKSPDLALAHQRIADCLGFDAEGRLYQRREHLNLAGLKLSNEELETPFDVPERSLFGIQFAQLRHLRFLDLTGNRLVRLPTGLEHFVSLEWLGLNFNLLKEIPGVERVRRLRRLYLRANPIGELPSRIGDLVDLEELDLTGCLMIRLPSALGTLPKLEYIGVTETGLVPDQRAAWQEAGWTSLRKHLAETQVQASVVQHLGKVVLVGAQENGKTCLQRALRGQPFVEGLQSTDGMSREHLHLRLDGSRMPTEERQKLLGPRADVIDLTLWDMGGQEHYQHTHQMFFTPSAVYLVVTLPRQGGSAQELGRWIELVKRRTEGKAAVVIVSTCCAQHPPDAAISLDRLRQQHGDLVRGMVAVDSKDGTGIDELRRLIATLVQDPRNGCRHEWLPGWAGALQELGSVQEAYIRWPRVEEICGRHGITEPQVRRQVVRTGHYIGSVLWREDIPAGEDVLILNPDWLCRAVARLLDDAETRRRDGLIALSDLPRVWEREARDGTPGYPVETHPALVELMEINELAYRPRTGGKKVGDGDHLLVTQMVQTLPDPDLDKIWESISPKRAAESVRVIAFRRIGTIHYEEVQDLVYLLIFRLREFSRVRSGGRAVHWQGGLLVTDDYGNAARIERTENGLRVTVRHRLGDGLLHTILHRIGTKDDGFWAGRGLKRFEFIPCPKDCPNQTPGRGLFDYHQCLISHERGVEEVQCKVCDGGMRINLLVAGAAVAPVDPALQEILKTIRDEGARTREAIEVVRTEAAMDADRILDAFTSEWRHGPRLFSLVPMPDPDWDPRRWVKMRFRLTVWCEASRCPVPLFRVPKRDNPQEMRGSVILELPREWVAGARRILKWGSLAMGGLAAGGGLGAAALMSAAGGVLDSADAAALAKELKESQGNLDALMKALPEESGTMSKARGIGIEADQNPFADPVAGLGPPQEEDLRLIRYLRRQYEEQDPEWGGLVTRDDGKFGRIWAHPLAPE